MGCDTPHHRFRLGAGALGQQLELALRTKLRRLVGSRAGACFWRKAQVRRLQGTERWPRPRPGRWTPHMHYRASRQTDPQRLRSLAARGLRTYQQYATTTGKIAPATTSPRATATATRSTSAIVRRIASAIRSYRSRFSFDPAPRHAYYRAEKTVSSNTRGAPIRSGEAAQTVQRRSTLRTHGVAVLRDRNPFVHRWRRLLGRGSGSGQLGHHRHRISHQLRASRRSPPAGPRPALGTARPRLPNRPRGPLRRGARQETFLSTGPGCGSVLAALP